MVTKGVNVRAKLSRHCVYWIRSPSGDSSLISIERHWLYVVEVPRFIQFTDLHHELRFGIVRIARITRGYTHWYRRHSSVARQCVSACEFSYHQRKRSPGEEYRQ